MSLNYNLKNKIKNNKIFNFGIQFLIFKIIYKYNRTITSNVKEQVDRSISLYILLLNKKSNNISDESTISTLTKTLEPQALGMESSHKWRVTEQKYSCCSVLATNKQNNGGFQGLYPRLNRSLEPIERGSQKWYKLRGQSIGQ